MKSIRVLLLLAVVQILFGSCLLWKETFLSLRQVNVYFLILIVGVSSFCAGINYFHTSGQKRHSILHSQKKVWMVYTILLVVNLLASCLVLSESIQIHNKLQQDLVDLFSFGISMCTIYFSKIYSERNFILWPYYSRYFICD